MSKEIIIRLVTSSGRSRIQLPSTATFGDFQKEVQTKTGVAPETQSFALDDKGSQPIGGAAAAALSSLGIVNGAMIWLQNKEAAIAKQVLTKVIVPVPEKPVAKAAAPAASGSGSSSSAPAPASSSAAASSSSTAGAGVSAKIDPYTGKKEVPFETFDHFLSKRQYDCCALPGNQKYVSGVVSDRGMIKIPPAVSIKQQPYRHVDTFSIVNTSEMEYFIGYWRQHLLENAMNRVGWMYGYYLEDKYYPEGTVAVLEGIYEPPQEMMGEMADPKDDPHRSRVDKVAEAMGLERIGWIFTSLPLDDDQLIAPWESQKMARLQNEHSTDLHFTKYRLSKFITCAIRPDPTNEGLPGMNAYMVSDQACAMVRDEILGEDADRKSCVVREAKKAELIPDFLVEGKANKKILPEFFVVRLIDSTPKKPMSLFTHASFPRENRPTQPQRRDDLKKYFKGIAKSEPSWSQFADFHLILYIAQEIDVDTAITIAECVRDRQEVPDGIRMIIDQIAN